MLIGEYVPLPPSTCPPLLSDELRIEIDPLPLATSVPTSPLVENMPSTEKLAATVPSRPVLDDGHLRAVRPVSVHGRPVGLTDSPPEQLVMLALEMLPPLPGSTIGPVETEPLSARSHLNSPSSGPLKPRLLIVALIEPPGLAVTVAALATVAEAAISAVAINSDVSVLRIVFPLINALA